MRNQKIIISKNVDQQIVTEEIYLVTKACSYFFNAQHIYLKLSSIERSYFDYMCESMDYENRILLNPIFRKKYTIHYNKITSSKNAPSEHTLRRYESKLISTNLVIKVKKNAGVHYVNPKYVINGTISQRKKILLKLADKALSNEIDLSTIIDRPVDKIQPNPDNTTKRS